MAQFKIGDIVQLKSGGPAMTVAKIRDADKEYRCAWFKGASHESGFFVEDALQPYVAPVAR